MLELVFEKIYLKTAQLDIENEMDFLWTVIKTE
jgi:hypothetical protein